MKEEICICCNKPKMSVIETPDGFVCYLCYTSKKEAAEVEKSKRKCSHEEDDIQAEFFRLVPIFFPTLPDKLLFAVPNGGKRNVIEATRMKKQGVKAGVSDTLLLIPKKGFSCLCIEFKTKTGIQSPDQKEFQRQIEMCGGKYLIKRSASQGIEAMKEYLK